MLKKKLSFRSSVGKRKQPSQNIYTYHLKCVICDKVQDKGISTKYRVSEKCRAENLIEAAFFLQDNVYTKISDLDTSQKVFGADVFYHDNCLKQYELAKTPKTNQGTDRSTKCHIFQKYISFIRATIEWGNGISLSEIRDLINSNDDIVLKNNELKNFLEEEFNDKIQFCESDKKNQSSLFFFYLLSK